MPQTVQKVAEAIEGQGGRARFIQTDVGDAGQAQRLVDQTLQAFGRLDVLINNAGIIKTARFPRDQRGRLRRACCAVNLKGVFLVGQAAARAMVKQGEAARSSTCRRPTPWSRSPTRCRTSTSKGGGQPADQGHGAGAAPTRASGSTRSAPARS